MIKRKMISWMLAVAMILSMFVGIGVNDKVAGAMTTAPNAEGIIFGYTIGEDGNAEQVYVYSSSNKTLKNTTITLPDKIESHPIGSIGSLAFAQNNDSFFFQEVKVEEGVTIDASNCESLTKVNNYVGYDKFKATLILPKSVKEIGTNVLTYNGNYNHIYCDALNIDFKSNDYNGVTFHGFPVSTASKVFPEGKLVPSQTITDNNIPAPYSTKVSFDIGREAAWATAPKSTDEFYMYLNDGLNQDVLLNLSAYKPYPKLDHHTFDGFYTSDLWTTKVFDGEGKFVSGSTLLASDKKLHARFLPNTCSVYINNASTPASSVSNGANSFTYGNSYTMPTTYTGTLETGYNFDGYSLTNGGSKITDENLAKSVYSSKLSSDDKLILYTRKKEKEYTFTFDSGAAGTSATVPSETKLSYSNLNNRLLPTAPSSTWTGHTFVGWKVGTTDTILNGTDKYYKNVIDVVGANTTNVTLTAQWEDRKYTLIYQDENDNELCKETPNVGDRIVIKSSTDVGVNKTGYKFDGWQYGTKIYTQSDSGINPFNAGMGTKVVLKPKYTPVTYTVKYVPLSDDTWPLASKQVQYSQNFFYLESSKLKEGCTHKGWTKNSNKKGVFNPRESVVDYQPGEKVTTHFKDKDGETQELYPVYERNEYDIRYTYDASSGIKVIGDMPTSYVYGETKTLPTLSWTGHTFLGWFTSGGVEVKEISATQTGDVTVTAKWENLYSAGIVGNGIKTISCSKGTIASGGKATGLLFAAGDVLDKLTISVTQGYEITGYSIKENKTNKIVVEESLSKPSDKMVASKNYTFSTSDIIIEVKCKVIVNELPAGTVTTVSENGKYLIITDSNGVKKYVEIPKQGSELKDGMNEIQFTAQDGMVYKTTVSFTQPKQISTDAEVRVDSAGKYIVITYPSGDEQYVNIDLFNSETSNGVTKVFFEQSDGKKCYAIVDASTEVIPEEEKPDDEKYDDQKEETAKTFYHVASNVSYRIKNGYATASNPKKWYGLKKIVIKSSVKLDGVTYKINAIDKLAFFGIDSLKSVTIGKNVTKIGSKAFMKCGKLNKITIKASNLTSIGKNCFKDISKNCTIYIVAKKAEYTKLVKLIKKKSGCPKKTKFKRVKP